MKAGAEPDEEAFGMAVTQGEIDVACFIHVQKPVRRTESCAYDMPSSSSFHHLTAARPWIGRSAIHLAAKFGDVEIMQVVVSRGADLRAVDKRGMSAIEIALTRKHNDLISWIRSTYKQ